MRWWSLPLSLVAAAALAQDHRHGAAMGEGVASTGFAAEMAAGMATMMREMHAPGYSGNADVDFLAMMIPHHQGAVDMARLALIHGRDPATRKLAEEIIASQVVEIAAMKRRLAILRATPEAEAGEFPALGGTRGPAPR